MAGQYGDLDASGQAVRQRPVRPPCVFALPVQYACKRMRSPFLRTVAGILAFFAPAYVALVQMMSTDPVAGDGGPGIGVGLLGALSVLVAGLVPSLLFLRSGLPPNTRVGLAIVALALLAGECLSILYIVVMSGTTG